MILSSIPSLGIYPKYLKESTTYNCTVLLTAALFTVTKGWKHPTCPSIDEWINTLWSIQTME